MKVLTIAVSLAVLLGGGLIALQCSRSNSDALKGQQNGRLTFYGLVVDENGEPLEGATFDFDIERIPADWSFNRRGKPHEHQTMHAVSDSSGKFQMEIVGHIIRVVSAEKSGYRHFYEVRSGGSETRGADNTFIRLDAWSDPWYRSDPAHPAVYVLVKDGVNKISVLPTRGGFDSGGGTRWVRNEPMWPRKPSLPDVVYVGPTTKSVE